jgi:hypothetical protein
MPDQWDPKHPTSSDALPWENCHAHARQAIAGGGRWRDAFNAVVAGTNDLRQARIFYDYVKPYCGESVYRAPFRAWLWEHEKLVFDRQLPYAYAQAVAMAVQHDSSFDQDRTTRRLGQHEFLPLHWWDPANIDVARVNMVWTFKATLVLVSGYFEGALP